LALLHLDGYAVGALAVAVLAAGMTAPALAHLAEVNRLAETAQAYRALPQVHRAAGVLLDDKEASALENVLEIVAHKAPVPKYILCFPDCPEIYFLSDHDSPTRYIVGGAFVDDVAMVKAIAASPPAVVILRSGALSRGLMGKAIPEALGRAGYRLDRSLDSYIVYLPPEKGAARRKP